MATKHTASRLTPREHEVAALVAEGLTNREIGERLFISERTAEYHLEQIRNKLGLRSRVQIGAWVAQPGSKDLPAARSSAPSSRPWAHWRRALQPRQRVIGVGVLTAVILVTALVTGIRFAGERPNPAPSRLAVWTVAGTGIQAASADAGLARRATLIAPGGMAFDGSGNLYFVDGSFRVRRVTPDGMIDTAAGSGTSGYEGDGGGALTARLAIAWGVDAGAYNGIALGGAGDLYIADARNNLVRKVSGGQITTVAGDPNSPKGSFGTYGGDGGSAVGAELNLPRAVAINRQGELFIADTNNHRVRKVDAQGIITTYAGTGEPGFGGDGGPATASQLSSPEELTFDGGGNLYVADTANHRIRRVDSATQVITTYAGSGESGSSGDGNQAAAARLDTPLGMALDSRGNFYYADSVANRIRRIDLKGTITTVVGNGERAFSRDGGIPAATPLYFPKGLAIGKDDILYFSDSGTHRIRAIRLRAAA